MSIEGENLFITDFCFCCFGFVYLFFFLKMSFRGRMGSVLVLWLCEIVTPRNSGIWQPRFNKKAWRPRAGTTCVAADLSHQLSDQQYLFSRCKAPCIILNTTGKRKQTQSAKAGFQQECHASKSIIARKQQYLTNINRLTLTVW